MLHHSVNSLQLPFPSTCKILASTHPLPADLLHMHVETVCILTEGSLHHNLCSLAHSWPTGHSAVWYRTLLHVHTVALPYYKHLHPLLCELTVSQLPNGWPCPVQSYRFSGYHSGCSSNDGFSGFLHHANICWDNLKECTASTLQVTESGSGGRWSKWEVT